MLHEYNKKYANMLNVSWILQKNMPQYVKCVTDNTKTCPNMLNASWILQKTQVISCILPDI